jgi:2-hydroxychromene-2-carboxylate isomerase
MLKLYYDVVCPFAYAAFLEAPRLAEEAGVVLEAIPVLLGGVMRAVGAPSNPNAIMPEEKRQRVVQDACRAVARQGRDLQWPEAHPMRTVSAMRLILGTQPSAQRAVALELYEAYWLHGRDITSPAVLEAIGGRHGVDVAAVLNDPIIKAQLRQNTEALVARGGFGVPTFVVGEQFFWGVDRVDQVRDALGLPPRLPVIGGRADARVVFYHDVSSPYSYLASRRVAGELEASGVQVDWKPFLLGAVFKMIGGPLVPIQAYPPARSAYLSKDLQDQAKLYGVPFQFSRHFPLRTVTAQRVQLVEPATTACIYEAVWVNNRDVGDPEVLCEVLVAAGFDGSALIAATADPAIKQVLKDNTSEAVAAGACGAPTFVTDRGQVFWGQDRLPHVVETVTSR